MPRNVAIIIPARNEDKTEIEAQNAGALVLQHIVNLGKGCALKTGCDYAVRENTKKIVVIDADAQHDPKQIPQFIKALYTVDIAFGYRTLSDDMPYILRFGNKFISRMTAVLYNISLRDTQCGYRSFTAEAYKKVRWKAHDYSVESEM